MRVGICACVSACARVRECVSACAVCACARAVSKSLAERWLFRFWLDFLSLFHDCFDARVRLCVCCLCACERAISKFLAEGWSFRFWLDFFSSFHVFFDALSVLSLGQVVESEGLPGRPRSVVFRCFFYNFFQGGF